MLTLWAGGCSVNPRWRLSELPGAGRAVELTAVPFHPQEAHHCGPASLLTVLEASGFPADYDAIVERVYVPGLAGSLQAEMSATARHFGRVAYALPPTPDAVLAEVAAGRPVLVLLNLGVLKRPYWHYAVVVGYEPSSNRLLLRSGTERRLATRAPVWLRRWDWAGRWAVVLLAPGEWPVDPDRPRLLRALAEFEDSAEPEAASLAWSAAVEHWPDEPVAWLGSGNAAFALEDWLAAEAAYAQVLSLDPENRPARLNLAATRAQVGRPCAALEALGAAPPTQHPLHEIDSTQRRALLEACAAARSD